MGGLVATRDITLGTDTETYFESYDVISNMAFNTDYLESGMEIGNRFLIFLADYFGLGVYGYLTFCAAITFFCLGVFVYKSTGRYYWIATMLLIAIEFWFFTFTGMRQALAISILCVAYLYLVNCEIKKTLFAILFASLFHMSAYVFLVILLIAVIIDWLLRKNISPMIIILSIAFLCFMVLFFKDIIPSLVGEKYQHYFLMGSIYSQPVESDGIVHYFKMICYSILFWLEYFFMKKDTDDKYKTYINMLLLLFTIVFFMYQHLWMTIFNRMTVMFEIYVIVCVPHVLYNMQNKYCNLIIETGILFYGYLTIMNVLNKNYGGIY